MQEYVNNIINKKYNTNKGYLYLLDLLKIRFPNFNINFDNLKEIKFEVMNDEYANRTQRCAEYRFGTNTLLINPIMIEKNQKEQKDDLFLNSFLHELIHCVTSKKEVINNKYVYIVEGVNLRSENNDDSLFLGINEGLTQYITNQTLGMEDISYRLDVRVVEQLVSILGENYLIECYSNNKYNELGKELGNKFLNDSYLGHYAVLGLIEPAMMTGLLTRLQNSLVELYNMRDCTDTKFYESVFDIEGLLKVYAPEIKDSARKMLENCLEGYERPAKKIY
ncbi:MAG TPA: hypothetical protein PKY25_01650 [Bacilli bacterium]|nr:hypothetical protein [Bacilli bacterium]